MRVESAITADGELDEGDWHWRSLPLISSSRIPRRVSPSTERTEVRLLYDDENLYVGVYCFDSAGPEGLVVHQVTRDFSGFEEDQFGVILDTFDDNRNGFLFNTILRVPRVMPSPEARDQLQPGLGYHLACPEQNHRGWVAGRDRHSFQELEI